MEYRGVEYEVSYDRFRDRARACSLVLVTNWFYGPGCRARADADIRRRIDRALEMEAQ